MIGVTTERFMVARSWLDGELARLSYRDGWEFLVGDQHGVDGLEVLVRWTFQCRHNPDRMVTFRQSECVDLIAYEQDLDLLHRTVLDLIAVMESHERLEWFHRDVDPVYDPHPDGPNVPRVRI